MYIYNEFKFFNFTANATRLSSLDVTHLICGNFMYNLYIMLTELYLVCI